LFDLDRARRSETLYVHLVSLADRIDAWHLLGAVDLESELTEVLPAMTMHLRDALELLEAMPSHGPLGPVRGR
jgi:hypothetical protein